MKSGCSASSCSGGHSASAFSTSSCHQTSRPSCIGHSIPQRSTTTTCSSFGSVSSTSSTLAFIGVGLPRRSVPSAVTSTFASETSMRSRTDSTEKPPKTTLWVAPMRAQASIAAGVSGSIGM